MWRIWRFVFIVANLFVLNTTVYGARNEPSSLSFLELLFFLADFIYLDFGYNLAKCHDFLIISLRSQTLYLAMILKRYTIGWANKIVYFIFFSARWRLKRQTFCELNSMPKILLLRSNRKSIISTSNRYDSPHPNGTHRKLPRKLHHRMSKKSQRSYNLFDVVLYFVYISKLKINTLFHRTHEIALCTEHQSGTAESN